MTDANGVSRGFGFVSFANAEQANAALREMNGRMLNNKPLIVNIAQRRDQRYTMLRMQFQQRLHLMMKQMQQQQQQQQQQHQFQQQSQLQGQANFSSTTAPQRAGRGRGGRSGAGLQNRPMNFAMPLPLHPAGMMPPINFSQPPSANASSAQLAGGQAGNMMMMMPPMQPPMMPSAMPNTQMPLSHPTLLPTQQVMMYAPSTMATPSAIPVTSQ